MTTTKTAVALRRLADRIDQIDQTDTDLNVSISIHPSPERAAQKIASTISRKTKTTRREVPSDAGTFVVWDMSLGPVRVTVLGPFIAADQAVS